MSLNIASDRENGIYALSIDAGSLASIMSSIGVLQELMRRVQKVSGLSKLPNPWEYFDLMVGAGFAGLLVIMLGRLRMSLDDTKLYCTVILNEVFSERKLFSNGESFKAAKLEAAIKHMLKSCGAGADTRMMDTDTLKHKRCKVMVCVGLQHPMDVGMPVFLRTYKDDRNDVPDCTIVEAVRATFALPGLFKPAVIMGSGGVKASYIGLGSMDPIAQLLEEATYVFLAGRISSVVSIGAGQKQTDAIDGDLTAQKMISRFANTPGAYFRFRVERGMQDIGLMDWQNLSKGIVHARAYLALHENEGRINELAQMLGTKEKAFPAARLNGAVLIASNTNHRIGECPPPSPLFVGQEAQLGCIKRCLVNGSEERHVCVLHGLGGAGKTQLALKFLELYKNQYQHIFYIDSSSAQTIETDLKNIALVKHTGDNSSDALTWLARLRENWLVVYNGADDTKLNLQGYFPACSHGNVLITTRNSRMIKLAQGVDADCHVAKMTQEDAEKLLAKAAGVTEDVGPTGLELIKELDYFALAIVQAGAYIRTRCCTMAHYLDTYKESRGKLLEEYSELVEKAGDYERTAYATWRVSYAQLKPTTKELYDMLAFMHHDWITEDIFRYAVIGMEKNKWNLPPTDDEFIVQKTTNSVLAKFTKLTDGSWDKALFMRAIEDLQSYSFIAHDRLNQKYSIHPLVHEWTRTMVIDASTMCRCTSLLLASSVIEEYRGEDMAFRRTLLSHIDSLPVGEKLRPRLAERFMLVYSEAGRENDAEKLAKLVLEASTKVHGREHPNTLGSMSDLAVTYSAQGRWQEAEVLGQEVVELRKRVRGSEHPETIASMGNLAVVYSGQGRWQEAEVLQREAIELSKQVQGDDHPNTLENMASLASTQSMQGQWKEAEVLQREVLELSKRAQGSEHPITLGSMDILASMYSEQGRWREAYALQKEVLEIRKRVQGSEHPSTIASMSNLAGTYSNQGRWQEAEVLGREVLKLNKWVLGSENPVTMVSMNNLADMYWRQGRWREAEMLQQEVLGLGKIIQGSEHPDTLTVMGNLALTYSSQARWQEAEVLQREVLELNKRTQGSENPNLLISMSNLAFTIYNQGRWQEAEVLQLEVRKMNEQARGVEHPLSLMNMSNLALTYLKQERWTEAEVLGREVLELRKRALCSEHPDILTSMNNLAVTYSGQGRWQDAEVLQQEVLELRKRVQGSEHPETLTSMSVLADMYSNQGRLQDAVVLRREVLELRKRVIGNTHPDTLTSMQLLAVTYSGLGQFCTAKILMETAVNTSKSALGVAHPDTVSRLRLLSELESDVLARRAASLAMEILHPWYGCILVFAILMIRSLLVSFTKLGFYLLSWL